MLLLALVLACYAADPAFTWVRIQCDASDEVVRDMEIACPAKDEWEMGVAEMCGPERGSEPGPQSSGSGARRTRSRFD